MALRPSDTAKLAAVFALFMIGTGAALFSDNATEKKAGVWKSILEGEHARAVVGGKKILIVNGGAEAEKLTARERYEALRIGAYTAAHRVNPLLALPGAETAELQKALFLLREISEDLSSRALDSRERRAAQVLHPLPFLEKLPALEELRRSMHAFPSARNIRKYHLSLEEALESYEREIGAFASEISFLPDHTLFFLYRQTDKKTYAEALEALLAQSRLLREEERRRFDCFSGKTDACAPLFRPLVPEPSLSERTTETPEPDVLSFLSEWYDPASDVTPAYETAVEGAPETVFLARAYCSLSGEETYLSFRLTDKESGLSATKAEPLSELFFLETKAEPAHSDLGYARYVKALAERGFTLQYQPFNFYSCPESGYDEMRILSTTSLYRLVAEEPLAPLLEEKVAGRIAHIEEEMRKSRPMRDAVAERYASALGSLLAEREFRMQLYDLGKSSLVERMEERLNLWRSQSAEYEKAALYAAILNRSLLFYSASFGVRPSDLTLSRSYPSLFFLPSNMTVMSLPPRFSTGASGLLSGEFSPFERIRRFTRDLRGIKSVEELLEEARAHQRFSHELRDMFFAAGSDASPFGKIFEIEPFKP